MRRAATLLLLATLGVWPTTTAAASALRLAAPVERVGQAEALVAQAPIPGTFAVGYRVVADTMPTQMASTPRLYGVLQPSVAHRARVWQAGIRLQTFELGWDAYEPTEEGWDATYIQQQRDRLAGMRAAGFAPVLDLGLQYPPAWLFSLPDSRFVNQYGDAYGDGPGTNGANAIFNQAVRDRQARYIARVLRDLGRDFYAIRVGGGSYGEVGYPHPVFGGHDNGYWAYDRIAQGTAPGLPIGMTTAPIPGWYPGMVGTNHLAAATFVDWYLASLQHYHDWQIATVRRLYAGRIAVLYPSWGLRPGQLDEAIADDLGGMTSAEINGEVQRGFDFARLVGAINDPNVLVYTTWLDADDSGDTGADRRNWSPVRYLAALADANAVHPRLWGENTGRGDLSAMQRSFRQMRSYNLLGLLWAFEPELHGGGHASLSEYAALIEQAR